MIRHTGFAIALITLVALSSTPRCEAAPPSGTVTGRIIDAETHEPIGWTTVALVELARAERSHRDGTFHFLGIPAGRYTLRLTHLGYRTLELPIAIPDEDSLALTIELESTALSSQTVVVTAESIRESSPYRPSETIDGARLQSQLGRTLAETIGAEAGVAQRSMGPATARPVVRGLGGDRLQLLEDGVGAGDLSATSSDHAVTIDPLNAERVEIVQGPASLLYSANTLGGVVNLVRNRVAGTPVDRVVGIASLQAESVNDGYTGGLSASAPVGDFALKLDGSARRASDIHTGDGLLGNTDYDAWNGSLGVSYFAQLGHIGAAGGALRTEYGVPGGFDGAHAEGVRVEMDRQFVEGEVELFDIGAFGRIETRGAYSRYRHTEVEAGGDVGTEYGLLSYEASALLHHDTLGFLPRGTFGVRIDHRNLVANGVLIPPSDEAGLAAFAYEEGSIGRLSLRGAARLDYRSIAPERDAQGTQLTATDRDFVGISGSLSATYATSGALQFGVTIMRTFRTPTIDELFSQGPHLASYSYEVGNPELSAEIGHGVELAARYADDRGHFSAALFRNDIGGYIYPRNTGDTSPRLQLPIYQLTGSHVVMRGFEVSAEWELLDGLVASGTASYVAGTLADDETPLPMIPPFSARVGIRYGWSDVRLGATLRGASAQDRVAAHEEPTPGYVVADLYAQVQYLWLESLHAVVLSIDNVADTSFRNHLSRTKAIMPEPGRNVRLLYRLYF